jgi:hypothetical protein
MLRTWSVAAEDKSQEGGALVVPSTSTHDGRRLQTGEGGLRLGHYGIVYGTYQRNHFRCDRQSPYFLP